MDSSEPSDRLQPHLERWSQEHVPPPLWDAERDRRVRAQVEERARAEMAAEQQRSGFPLRWTLAAAAAVLIGLFFVTFWNPEYGGDFGAPTFSASVLDEKGSPLDDALRSTATSELPKALHFYLVVEEPTFFVFILFDAAGDRHVLQYAAVEAGEYENYGGLPLDPAWMRTDATPRLDLLVLASRTHIPARTVEALVPDRLGVANGARRDAAFEALLGELEERLGCTVLGRELLVGP